MTTELNSWLHRKLKYWQALLFALLVMTFTGLATCSMSRATENYQYENIQRQKDIVDKRVRAVEIAVRQIDVRVSEAELKISSALADNTRVQRNLEDLMYMADPEVMKALARRSMSIHQTASPVINVNTGKHPEQSQGQDKK